MEKVGLFHFVAEPYLMDFRGRVTLPMIGNYLIHAASSHAGERGFGFNDMSERHTAWVLSRLAIEMKEYPTAFDKINLYTWIDEVGRLFTSRCFELADENGKTFGFARSIWAAIDVETRRPTLLDIEALGKYIDERPCPIEKPGKIMPVENKAEGIPYSIKYSDMILPGFSIGHGWICSISTSSRPVRSAVWRSPTNPRVNKVCRLRFIRRSPIPISKTWLFAMRERRSVVRRLLGDNKRDT